MQTDSAKLFSLNKSTRLAQDKVGRDIGKVMELVDQERTGVFTLKQVGQCLMMLRVVHVLFEDEES